VFGLFPCCSLQGLQGSLQRLLLNMDTDNGKNNILITVNYYYHHNFDKGGFRGDRYGWLKIVCVALEESDFSFGRNARCTSDLNTYK